VGERPILVRLTTISKNEQIMKAEEKLTGTKIHTVGKN